MKFYGNFYEILVNLGSTIIKLSAEGGRRQGDRGVAVVAALYTGIDERPRYQTYHHARVTYLPVYGITLDD